MMMVVLVRSGHGWGGNRRLWSQWPLQVGDNRGNGGSGGGGQGKTVVL